MLYLTLVSYIVILPVIQINMLDRDQVHNSLILVREIIFLRGHAIVMGLIIMDMSNFDVILCMDFLSRYGAKIN